jgi:bifunctional non-homologous end joining protein LigD
MQSVIIDEKQLKLTNLTKVFWPDDGIMKADFIDYIGCISPFMLPHLKDRPIVFTRYPDGIYGKSFYQKNVPDYAPSWLQVAQIQSGDGNITRYAVINDVQSLLWAANQASIEIHPWLSRKDVTGYPDVAVFDFDPMEKTGFKDTIQIALALNKLLSMEGLISFPKTSGATGLQVYVPIIERKYTYEQTRIFARLFCTVLEKTFPHITTLERNIHKREGKVYLDYLQNVEGKTLIAPYSPRPRQGAPVSCPLTWDELASGVTPEMFNMKNMPDRANRMGDIFEGVLKIRQNIDKWII